jgi:hypothetical protein
MTRVLGLHSRTGSAEAVALAVSGLVTFIDRWSLDLIDGRAERQIYHVVADRPLAEAETEVGRAIDVVTEIAVGHMRSILTSVGSVDAVGVVVGDFPVPDSLASIMAAHALMHAAEGAMFRDALLDAAAACGVPGLSISRAAATASLNGALADVVARVGSVAGRPWRKEHKLATVAAIIAAG